MNCNKCWTQIFEIKGNPFNVNIVKYSEWTNGKFHSQNKFKVLFFMVGGVTKSELEENQNLFLSNAEINQKQTGESESVNSSKVCNDILSFMLLNSSALKLDTSHFFLYLK